MLNLLCGLDARAATPAAPAVPAVTRGETTPLDDDGEMVLMFEPWSSRMAASEPARLDRLAAALVKQPGSRLFILAPQPADATVRRFVGSRLAAVERELGQRGIHGQRLKASAEEASEGGITLRMVVPAAARTPIEIAGGAGPATAPSGDAGNTGAVGNPLPLLPGPPPIADSTAPTGAAAPSATPEVEELWIASSGRSLREVLKEWGARAAWTVVWQSDHEYPLDASATFSGDFVTAASQLCEGFSDVAPAPLAQFYKGNRVLLVQSGEGR